MQFFDKELRTRHGRLNFCKCLLPRSADAALSSQYARSKEIKSGSMSIYWNISGDSIALALEASATGQASNPWDPLTVSPQPTLISPPRPPPLL
jgi:hypothetical protein